MEVTDIREGARITNSNGECVIILRITHRSRSLVFDETRDAIGVEIISVDDELFAFFHSRAMWNIDNIDYPNNGHFTSSEAVQDAE